MLLYALREDLEYCVIIHHPNYITIVAEVVQAAVTLLSSGFWMSSAATYSIYFFCNYKYFLLSNCLFHTWVVLILFYNNNCNCNAFLGFIYSIIMQSKRLDSATLSVKKRLRVWGEILWKYKYDISKELFDFIFMNLVRSLFQFWWYWLLDSRYFIFVNQASFSP